MEERGDYYGKHWFVTCVSVRCGINPKTSPCDHKGIERGRDGAMRAWNKRLGKTGI